jgi:hypothetical protein
MFTPEHPLSIVLNGPVGQTAGRFVAWVGVYRRNCAIDHRRSISDWARRGLGTLSIVVLAACLASCSTDIGSINASKEKLASIRSVTIVSGIGNTLQLSTFQVGTIFPRGALFHCEDLALDAFAAESAKALLATRYQVNVLAIAPEMVPLKSAQYLLGESPEPRYDSQLVKLLESQKQAPASDAFLVLRKYQSHGLPGSGPLADVTALGMTIHDSPNGGGVYASYWITLIDGHTFTVIAEAPAARNQPDEYGIRYTQAPPRNAEYENLWAPSYSAMLPEQKERLKNSLKLLIGESLEQTLKGMHVVS